MARLLFALLCSLLQMGAVAPSSSGSSSGSGSYSYSGMDKKKSDFRVDGLDEVVPAYAKFDGDMYAGTLPMDNGNGRRGEIMFWLFAPSKPAVRDTLVMWLNGGPGCSSFNAGVMMETAPVMIQTRDAGYCCLKTDEPLVYNPSAWTEATAMLYIEQPVGVGFSNGGPEPQDEDDVSGDVYAFLVNFYRVFDDFQPKRLFIVGESYAGMYVPAIARRVYLETEKFMRGDTHNRVKMNLAGVALGNGWVDAHTQGPATIDYAYWHGMIDSTTRDTIHEIWDDCMAGKKVPKPFHPFNIPDDCAMMVGVLAAAGAGSWPNVMSGPNTYDVTTWDSYGVLLGGNNSIAVFFNDPRVKEKLHAPDILWQGCIPGAGRRRERKLAQREVQREEQQQQRELLLEQDRPKSTAPYIAELLDDAGIRVLVYNGDRDLSTCAQGSEMYLDTMEWSGASTWKNAERGLWALEGDTPEERHLAGYAKEHKGLGFVVVYNSGHLVPFNVPVPALDLITRFLQNRSFKDYPLPSYKSSKTGTKEATKSSGAGKVEKLGDDSSTKPAPSRFWSGVTTLFVAFASFAVGFYASNYMRNKREGYEELSNHNGGCEMEPNS